MKLDFDSVKNRDSSLAAFKQLKDTPGWNLVVSIVTGNIEFLKEQLLNGVADEDIQVVNRIRDKIKDHQSFIGTPDYWIDKLKPIETTEKFNDDPYTSVELEQKNKK